MGTRHFDIRALRALVTVVDAGGVTEAARRLGRTQPAITLQIQRLEDLIGRPLFLPNSRTLCLSRDGEVLLGYARAMLQMHDEVWLKMQRREIAGRVIFGTPDLYAASLLPGILHNFRKAYPLVEVDLHCKLSRALMESLDASEIDLALVTGMQGIRAGTFIRKEPLVWVCSESLAACKENPVPLALLPPGNIYRDLALEALDRMGRPWRLVCISESIGGLQAAVFSGFAVSVVAKSAVVAGMRIIGRAESFPDLPAVDLVLHRAPGSASPQAQFFADFIIRSLAGGTPDAPTQRDAADAAPQLNRYNMPPKISDADGAEGCDR